MSERQAFFEVFDTDFFSRHLMARYYLDAEGKPVEGPEKGVVKTTFERDKTGKRIKTQKFTYLNGKYQLK